MLKIGRQSSDLDRHHELPRCPPELPAFRAAGEYAGGYRSSFGGVEAIPDPNAPPTATSGRRGAGDGEGGGARGPAVPQLMLDPVPAKLPGGVDFIGRPFSEPLLLTIAAAYEKATRHRTPPPNFGPLPATALAAASQ